MRFSSFVAHRPPFLQALTSFVRTKLLQDWRYKTKVRGLKEMTKNRLAIKHLVAQGVTFKTLPERNFGFCCGENLTSQCLKETLTVMSTSIRVMC